MKSKATRRFWKLYEQLPVHIQRLAEGITDSGLAILAIPHWDLNNYAALDSAFLFVLATIIARLATGQMKAWNGCGSVHTKSTTNS